MRTVFLPKAPFRYVLRVCGFLCIHTHSNAVSPSCKCIVRLHGLPFSLYYHTKQGSLVHFSDEETVAWSGSVNLCSHCK